MGKPNNFFLGHGEALVEKIKYKKPWGPKKFPYSADQAISRLKKQLEKTTKFISKIPKKACPKDEVVSVLKIHPTFLAKSYFPEYFLERTQLKIIGSKPVSIVPEIKTIQAKGPEISTAYFLAGKRENFYSFFNSLSSDLEEKFLEDLKKFDEIVPYISEEKI